MGWGERKILTYQGSLGLLNQNIIEVAEYFSYILGLMPDVRYLILTQNRSVNIAEVMRSHGISPEQFKVIHPLSADLPGWLSGADAGVHAMSPGPDSSTRLGVKVVEYLSCGLPVIVNPHVGAAAELVRAENVGVVLEVTEGEEGRAKLKSMFDRVGILRGRARVVAEARFSVESCALGYTSLYHSLPDRDG